MRATSLISALLVLTAALAAGCVTPANVVSPAKTSDGGDLLPDLSDLPLEPPLDATRGREWWESFVTATPYRHTGSPTNIDASDMLVAELEKAGFEARTIYFTPGTGTPSPFDQGIRTVIGIKEGSELPDHVIAWVAHYDTNAKTIYGAYDDGSGVAVAVELARALSTYDNRKTLMPIFFDAEEIGLVASDYFLKQVVPNEPWTFDLVIGHDMTGINCPGHEWKMWQFVGEKHVADVRPVLEALYDQQLTPEERACIAFHDQVTRNSDERRFHEAGFPTIRMAGGFKASDYPAYHMPNDTIEYVYEFAGGEENYELGFALTVKTSYWSTVAYDRLPSLVKAE